MEYVPLPLKSELAKLYFREPDNSLPPGLGGHRYMALWWSPSKNILWNTDSQMLSLKPSVADEFTSEVEITVDPSDTRIERRSHMCWNLLKSKHRVLRDEYDLMLFQEQSPVFHDFPEQSDSLYDLSIGQFAATLHVLTGGWELIGIDMPGLTPDRKDIFGFFKP